MKPRLAVRLCLVALIGTPLLATAAEEPPIPPTEITSKHGESLSTDTEMTTLFTDDVVVTGNKIRITCDRLEVVSVRFGEQDQVVAKQNRFKSLVATGHVNIVQGDREATCGRAVVLPDDDKITLTENPVVVDHGAGWTDAGEKITMWRGERRVEVEKPHLTGPALKDLSFDKNKKLESTDAPKPAVPDAAKPAPQEAK
jgi:lipopolysaccharide export system protein LptA